MHTIIHGPISIIVPHSIRREDRDKTAREKGVQNDKWTKGRISITLKRINEDLLLRKRICRFALKTIVLQSSLNNKVHLHVLW